VACCVKAKVVSHQNGSSHHSCSRLSIQLYKTRLQICRRQASVSPECCGYRCLETRVLCKFLCGADACVKPLVSLADELDLPALYHSPAFFAPFPSRLGKPCDTNARTTRSTMEGRTCTICKHHRVQSPNPTAAGCFC
jgi:hypothetical protein